MSHGVDETLYNPGAQTLPHSLGNEPGARFSCGKWEDLGPRQILLITSSQVDYSRLAPLKSSQRPRMALLVPSPLRDKTCSDLKWLLCVSRSPPALLGFALGDLEDIMFVEKFVEKLLSSSRVQGRKLTSAKCSFVLFHCGSNFVGDIFHLTRIAAV